MKTYVYNVPCHFTYTIDATSEEKAKEILQKHGGVDIHCELQIDDDDYKNADLVDVV